MARVGRPTEYPIKKLVALNQELVDGIAEFQKAAVPPIENQSDAVRRIIRDWLTTHGYLPSPKGD